MQLFFQRSILLQCNVLKTVARSLIFSKNYSYFKKWETPEGYDSGIKVYNAAVDKKVPLLLNNKGLATWYVCGPTVYAESHIGHASCYVKFDVMKRIMENIFNINVFLLMGITDIDDKIIKKSFQIGSCISEIAKRYEFEFFEDLAVLRVQTPNAILRVTENIPLIIKFIEKLIEKDFAYVTDEGNVYFIVSKGASAYMPEEISIETQPKIDSSKRERRDFALWKSSKPNEPYWLSPWGKGRPGWHIECSAMASRIFGSRMDIHSGGSDLQFPHHLNEISQSEAYHSCSQWVNYWFHSGLLHVGDDVKMSKSIQNTISIKEFLKENSVNDFRILCLQSPYHNDISFSNETLESAKGLHKKLHYFINECEEYVYGKFRILPKYEESLMVKLEITRNRVISYFADDFNTFQALLHLTELVDDVNEALETSTLSEILTERSVTSVTSCAIYINHILEILGVKILCKKNLRREFIHLMDVTIEFRNIIRLFALCQFKNTNSSAVEFITEEFKKIIFANNLFVELQEPSQNVKDINQAVEQFYEESLHIMSTLPNIDCVNLKDSQNLKAERKKREHLLSLCDNLRSTLKSLGIAIKDRRQDSTWLPLMDLKL